MGFARVAGGGRATVPSSGILASDLAVGSVVKLMESSVATDYLIVHQGLPSSLYDASCDGCWLLREKLLSSREWSTTAYNNDYANSAVNTWLNGDFLATLGSAEQAAIKQVKIPYRVGSGGSTVNSGANGLAVRAFLLGAHEIGAINGVAYDPDDGAKLDYFDDGNISSSNSKREAYKEDGSIGQWVLRSASTRYEQYVWGITAAGDYDNTFISSWSYPIRPALILPSTALFNEDTLLLKGVA